MGGIGDYIPVPRLPRSGHLGFRKELGLNPRRSAPSTLSRVEERVGLGSLKEAMGGFVEGPVEGDEESYYSLRIRAF